MLTTVAKNSAILCFWSKEVTAVLYISISCCSYIWSLFTLSASSWNFFNFSLSLILDSGSKGLKNVGILKNCLHSLWKFVRLSSTCLSLSSSLNLILSAILVANKNYCSISWAISSSGSLLFLLKFLFYFSLGLKANKWLYSSGFGCQSSLSIGNFNSSLLFFQ